MTKKEKYILFFLLVFLVVIRLYHLHVPPLEIEECWRQADTESMAWNFVQYDFNPLHPNLNYDGPFPNIPALEIQVTTFIIAILYKVFGHHYLLARIVPLTFFLLSGIFLYLFARIHLGWKGAAWGLFIYAILPINVYYSRAIMPESAALMFSIGGLYYFNCWASEQDDKRERRKWKLALSSLFLATAIMIKPPVIFIALPMFYLCYRYFNWSWLKLPELWGYALVTLSLPAIYYYYSAHIADYKFTVGITRNIIFKKALTAFFSPEAIQFYAHNIPRTIGVIAILLVIIGLFAFRKKQAVIYIWFSAMLLEVIFIVSPIRATYYLIFFAAPCALLIGNLLHRITTGPIGKLIASILVAAMVLNTYEYVQPMFKINPIMQNQVRVVQELTTREDLLVVGSFDPCLLSLSDRRGWRYNLRIYPDTPKDPMEELNYYIERGAKYFVPIQGKVYGDDGDKLLKQIEGKYSKIELLSGYPIYLLH